MGLITTDSQNYTDIANAIRSKTGTASTFLPSEMASVISSIPTEGGGSADYLETRAALSGSYYSTATSIPAYAFACISSLTAVSLPNITSVPSGAFMSCYNMETINAPSVKSTGVSAFYHCDRLLYASFPECTATNAGAFTNCSSMSYASFPKLTTINGFSYCYKLTTFYAPLATSIVNYGLYDNSALTSVTLSSLRGVGNQAFRYCWSLSEIDLPAAYLSIGSGAFNNCEELKFVKLGSNTASSSTTQIIYSSAFSACYNLLSLYLYNSTMWMLSNANAFTSTPISTYTTSTGGVNGSIFVPASLVDTYKSATNWATYSDRIASIPA